MNVSKYIRILVVTGLFSLNNYLSANDVHFSGERFKFTVNVEGRFELIEKNSEINQMLAKFIGAKGDLNLVREFYDENSKTSFDSLTGDEKSKLAFVAWMESMKSIRARAIIKREGDVDSVFLHLNEGTTGEMIMEAGINLKAGSGGKLVMKNIFYPKGGSPEYWIVELSRCAGRLLGGPVMWHGVNER